MFRSLIENYCDLQGGAQLDYESIEETKEAVKREIRKEMKIKEGAEKLREATSDKETLAHVKIIVKKANDRLQELQRELQDLNACFLMTNSLGSSLITGLSLLHLENPCLE